MAHRKVTIRYQRVLVFMDGCIEKIIIFVQSQKRNLVKLADGYFCKQIFCPGVIFYPYKLILKVIFNVLYMEFSLVLEM